MYQINLRAQASKLMSLTAHWPITRVQQHAEPRRHIAHLHKALAELANLATLRVMPEGTARSAGRRDPRDPRNW